MVIKNRRNKRSSVFWTRKENAIFNRLVANEKFESGKQFLERLNAETGKVRTYSAVNNHFTTIARQRKEKGQEGPYYLTKNEMHIRRLVSREVHAQYKLKKQAAKVLEAAIVPEKALITDLTKKGYITHSFLLRENCIVKLELPNDLNTNEAERLSRFIKTLPF